MTKGGNFIGLLEVSRLKIGVSTRAVGSLGS
jgi:hypothetical protein